LDEIINYITLHSCCVVIVFKIIFICLFVSFVPKTYSFFLV